MEKKSKKNNMKKLIMMIGLSGSGKSTKAKELQTHCPESVIISSDELRKELLGNEEDQSQNPRIFEEFRKRVWKHLKDNRTVIADATHLTQKSRASLLGIAKKLNVPAEAYLVVKPVTECILDDLTRSRVVGRKTIVSQVKKFEVPVPEEGFRSIRMISPEQKEDAFLKRQWGAMEQFYQKNDYHDHYLSTHCENTAKLFEEYHYGEVYGLAAKYHDFGKLYTATEDESGKQHYYNHENVGAYELLCHTADIMAATGFTEKDVLEMAFLINYHMKPLHWTTEKAKERSRSRLGERRMKLIEDFNQCDKSRELEEAQTMRSAL